MDDDMVETEVSQKHWLLNNVFCTLVLCHQHSLDLP